MSVMVASHKVLQPIDIIELPIQLNQGTVRAFASIRLGLRLALTSIIENCRLTLKT
jgi:hypothetical protein